MKKEIKILILILVIIVLGVILYINKTRDKYLSKEIYVTTYYFAFGSRRVKVCDNGDVYDDLEIEDPNHVVNYKFVKRLSNEQINILKEKITNNVGSVEIDNYIIEEVYKVKKFGNIGQY